MQHTLLLIVSGNRQEQQLHNQCILDISSSAADGLLHRLNPVCGVLELDPMLAWNDLLGTPSESADAVMPKSIPQPGTTLPMWWKRMRQTDQWQ